MRDLSTSELSHNIEKIGDFQNGEIFKVTLKIPFSLGWLERVNFSVQDSNKEVLYQMKHLKNENDFSFFEATVNLETSAIYHYHFSFEGDDKFRYYKKYNITGDNSVSKEECWKMSVGFDVPEWVKGANMYHIFVDRYRKSKNKVMQIMPRRIIHENWNDSPILGARHGDNWNIDFYGGDLLGIVETLPYLRDLNIDIIYLSPICQSQSNHRYDTGDYENVDPYAGSNQDLQTLCNKAHELGMKVILDSVFNHTGNDSKYFNQFNSYDSLGAYQSVNSPYYDFYKKNHYGSDDKFSYWWGMRNLPECDSNSEHWRNYICGVGGVIDKWFSLGIDGLRLDVADELSDQFIEEITEAAKRNKPDSFVIGEVWKNPMRMNRGYISSGRGMHSVMNYLLVDALIRYYKYCDTYKLESIIQEILTEYPNETINCLMNFTSTHDISRAVEIFGADSFQEHDEWAWNLRDNDLVWVKSHHLSNKEYAKGKICLKSYVTALAFLPGIFSIFYGDEAGLQGIGNLANRAPFPWDNIDIELLDFFKSICKLRHDEKFLKDAKLRVLEITPQYFAFERYDVNHKIIVVASRSHKAIKLDEKYKNLNVVFSLNCCDNGEILSPYGALILRG